MTRKKILIACFQVNGSPLKVNCRNWQHRFLNDQPKDCRVLNGKFVVNICYLITRKFVIISQNTTFISYKYVLTKGTPHKLEYFFMS